MNNSKKTLRFLAVSLIAVSLLCVCIFSFLAFYMSLQSGNTIGNVGKIYMLSLIHI